MSRLGRYPRRRQLPSLPVIKAGGKEVAGDTSFGVRTNRFGFNITAKSNLVIVVEACILANPTWIPLQTNMLPADSCCFSDPAWTNNPGRFYRLRSP